MLWVVKSFNDLLTPKDSEPMMITDLAGKEKAKSDSPLWEEVVIKEKPRFFRAFKVSFGFRKWKRFLQNSAPPLATLQAEKGERLGSFPVSPRIKLKLKWAAERTMEPKLWGFSHAV